MLSKATTVCSLSLKTANRAAFYRLISPTTQVLSSASRITSKLNYAPRFSFAELDEKEKLKTKLSKSTEKVQPKRQESEQLEESDEEAGADFVEFMQKNEQSNISYEFNNKTIFEVVSNPDEFTRRYLYYWGMGGIWFGVSYLVFNFINPWLAIVPCWFLAGSLVAIRMNARFSKTMVRKIELVDHEHVKIYPLALKGKDVLCNIKDTEILGMKSMTESPQLKDERAVKSYLIMANFMEATKKKSYPQMRLIVDPRLTTVPNIDLLKSVLHGDTAEIAKFRFVEKSEEEKAKEKEKLERNNFEDAGGEAKFDFAEEEFEQFKKELQKESKQETINQESQTKK